MLSKDELLKIFNDNEKDHTVEEMREMFDSVRALSEEEQQELYNWASEGVSPEHKQKLNSLTTAWYQTMELVNSDDPEDFVVSMDTEVANAFIQYAFVQVHDMGFHKMVEDGPRIVFQIAFALGLNVGIFHATNELT